MIEVVYLDRSIDSKLPGDDIHPKTRAQPDQDNKKDSKGYLHNIERFNPLKEQK